MCLLQTKFVGRIAPTMLVQAPHSSYDYDAFASIMAGQPVLQRAESEYWIIE